MKNAFMLYINIYKLIFTRINHRLFTKKIACPGLKVHAFKPLKAGLKVALRLLKDSLKVA